MHIERRGPAATHEKAHALTQLQARAEAQRQARYTALYVSARIVLNRSAVLGVGTATQRAGRTPGSTPRRAGVTGLRNSMSASKTRMYGSGGWAACTVLRFFTDGPRCPLNSVVRDAKSVRTVLLHR